jgi:peptide/nickel transport system substrate-binding protein
MIKRLLGTALLLITVMPLFAQPPAGRGLIKVIDPNSLPANRVCSALACDQVMEWIYPPLFATDPVTGVVVPPSEDNFGLVESILLTDEKTQQLRLRDDLFWGDGQPVTAYDVLFSLILLQDASFAPTSIASEIKAVTAEDDYTLTVEFNDPDCAVPAHINFLVRPAHMFVRDFPDGVNWMNSENGRPLTFAEWNQTGLRDQRSSITIEQLQAAHAGPFTDETPPSGEPFQLVSGETAIVIRDLESITPQVTGSLPASIGPVEAFLAGEVTYLINPPMNRRADLLAQPDLQIAVEPSERWAVLMFNFANPDKPRDAFDAKGNRRDQEMNPTVSDPAVRQAIRHAIDVDAIIDVVYQGYAEPLASLWPPTSWAHDANRPAVEYDFRAAEDILQEAGWWDADRDGVRECRECATAPLGTPLTLDMVTDDSLYPAAEMIARQLSRIGINVVFSGERPEAQRFDLYLSAQVTAPMDDPDLSHWFAREYDRRGQGIVSPNYGSFDDERIEQLFTEARTVASCEVPARRELYSQIQDELDAQIAVIPLFVEQDMFVAQPSVLGFDPLPARPLWNIRDWVVMP